MLHVVSFVWPLFCLATFGIVDWIADVYRYRRLGLVEAEVVFSASVDLDFMVGKMSPSVFGKHFRHENN